MHLHFFPFWVCDMHNTSTPEHLVPGGSDPSTKSIYSVEFLLSSVGCSGSHQEQKAAIVGWIGALRRRPGPHSELENAPKIKPRSFLALCSPFKTQDQASSLHWFHERAIRDDTGAHRNDLGIWCTGCLCISAFTATDVPGNQHRKYLRRVMWQIWTYLIERK